MLNSVSSFKMPFTGLYSNKFNSSRAENVAFSGLIATLTLESRKVYKGLRERLKEFCAEPASS